MMSCKLGIFVINGVPYFHMSSNSTHRNVKWGENNFEFGYSMNWQDLNAFANFLPSLRQSVGIQF